MEAVKNYSSEQIENTRKLLDVLAAVPEQRRTYLTAMATAYVDGIEAGTRLAQKNRKDQ